MIGFYCSFIVVGQLCINHTLVVIIRHLHYTRHHFPWTKQFGINSPPYDEYGNCNHTTIFRPHLCHTIQRTNVHKWRDPHVFWGSYVISILKTCKKTPKNIVRIFPQYKCPIILLYLHRVNKMTIDVDVDQFLWNLDSMTFDTKMS